MTTGAEQVDLMLDPELRHELLMQRLLEVLPNLLRNGVPSPDEAIFVWEDDPQDGAIHAGLGSRAGVLETVSEVETTGAALAKLRPAFDECPRGSINVVVLQRTGMITYGRIDLSDWAPAACN